MPAPKSGLLPLVSNAKIHRICLLPTAQAKFSWPGSDLTSVFWQAVVTSAWTRVTLPGQAGLLRARIPPTTVPAMASTASPRISSRRRPEPAR